MLKQEIKKIIEAFERRGLTQHSLEKAIGKKIEELSVEEVGPLRDVYKKFLQGKNILEAASPVFVELYDSQALTENLKKT